MERPAWRRGGRGGLLLSLFVIPMLLGVLTFGYRLWQAQKYDPYEPRIYASQIVGTFDCVGLVDRVKSTVVNDVSKLGVPIDPSWVDAVVVDVDPTGVLVDVTVRVPSPDGSGKRRCCAPRHGSRTSASPRSHADLVRGRRRTPFR